VIGAAKEVIDGHGGIWQTPFLQFIASLLFQHVEASRKAPEGETSVTPKAQPATSPRSRSRSGRSSFRSLDPQIQGAM
jgi:hypothetical protein